MVAPVPSPNLAIGKTILVADDEESMRKVLERRLVSWGFSVVMAQDGAEAVRLATTCQPHLILMDIMMPQLDGLSACRQLKDANTTRHIPIIMITAKESKSLAHDVSAAGADDFLKKPYEPADLLSFIERALNHIGFPPSVS